MGDIDKVLEIEKDAFPKTAYPRKALLDYANAHPEGFTVIETGEDIAGYIIFGMDGHIISTAVKSRYRRKGFGTILFMHALKCAEKRLWLEVRSKNRGAIAFYKKMGMKIAAKVSNYYEDDDALVMVLGKSNGQR